MKIKRDREKIHSASLSILQSKTGDATTVLRIGLCSSDCPINCPMNMNTAGISSGNNIGNVETMHVLRIIPKEYFPLRANTLLLCYSLKQPLFANFHKCEKIWVTLKRAKGCCVSRILNNPKTCTMLNLYTKLMENLLRTVSNINSYNLFNTPWEKLHLFIHKIKAEYVAFPTITTS